MLVITIILGKPPDMGSLREGTDWLPGADDEIADAKVYAFFDYFYNV